MTCCYNCGKPISKKDGTETRDHIPAQNLFAGYGDEFKMNRIVVPACRVCNGGSSTVDEEFRNMIGIISNYGEQQTISANAAKLHTKSNLIVFGLTLQGVSRLLSLIRSCY